MVKANKTITLEKKGLLSSKEKDVEKIAILRLRIESMRRLVEYSIGHTKDRLQHDFRNGIRIKRDCLDRLSIYL